MTTRLQKVLASSGLGSRRACEALITEGRVTVDGRTATIGMSVEPGAADVRVDGVRVRAAEALVYLALYKPVGVVTASRSQDGRTTVLDLVDVRERIFPVGRLDVDSEGLVLLTNDGLLAQVLTHPRHGHEKEYRVLLDAKPSADQLRRWRDGVRLPDSTRALPASVQLEGAGTWVRVIMRQGRKRQIRETAGLLGLHVQRLVRVRIASLRLGELRPGQWRVLTPEEVRGLRLGMPAATGPKAKRSPRRDGRVGSAEGRG